MDVSIFVEAWRESIKHAMRRESFLKKIIVALGGVLTMLCCSLLGAYFMGSWSNVLQVQKMDELVQYWNTTEDGVYINSTYYDINYINGTFDDKDAAADLYQSLNDTDGYSWQKQGSQWSLVYAFAGWTLVLAAINGVLLILGGWFYKPRMVGMFCHVFLMIFDLASLIITHKFRYRDQGKLAALSNLPSRAKSDSEFDSDWTYKNDAEFIDKIWLWQLVLFIFCFITS
mmetsp:Transcript_35027/g.42899  ORF Transcript_35027/g.42899 Transcript_35027/m.42899 type:complete len:229 (-) Transcript_35027:440-1126(-)